MWIRMTRRGLIQLGLAICALLLEAMERFRKETFNKTSSTMLLLLSTYEEKTCLPKTLLQWPPRLSLMKLRKRIKVCVGMDYIIAQLSTHLPKDPAEFPKHAATIIADLAGKGVSASTSQKGVALPSFVAAVLAKMGKPLPIPVAASAAADAADNVQP